LVSAAGIGLNAPSPGRTYNTPMLTKPRAFRFYNRACGLVLYLLVAAAAFHGSYDKWHFAEAGVRGESRRSSFESIMDGTADRPFVYRQLLPATANFLDRNVPQSWLAALFAHQGSDPPGPLEALANSPTTRNPVYLYRYLLLYAETFLSALVALCAMHLVCKELAFAPITTHLAPAILLLLIPYFQSAGGYYYDYPELAFFALALWIALRHPWGWLLPIAALATANKESFVLLLPALYPILRRRHSRTRSALALGLGALTCIAVYLPIRMHFAGNPGTPLEWHAGDQFRYLMDGRGLLLGTEATYGIRVLKAFTVVPLALIVWTGWRGWKELPTPFRRHAQIAAAINLPLFFFFCWPSEMRDLSLLYPTWLLVIAVSLDSAFRISAGNRPRSDSAPAA
jgi:hypothetical protein